MPALDDPFDAVHGVEEESIQRGREDGIKCVRRVLRPLGGALRCAHAAGPTPLLTRPLPLGAGRPVRTC